MNIDKLGDSFTTARRLRDYVIWMAFYIAGAVYIGLPRYRIYSYIGLILVVVVADYLMSKFTTNELLKEIKNHELDKK